MSFTLFSQLNALKKCLPTCGSLALGLSGTAPSWGCSACSSACHHPLWLMPAGNTHELHTIQSTECFEEVFANLRFISFGAIRHSSILRLLCLLLTSILFVVKTQWSNMVKLYLYCASYLSPLGTNTRTKALQCAVWGDQINLHIPSLVRKL